MNFRIFLCSAIGIAALTSCSGWKTSSNSSSVLKTNSSSKNVNVDTPYLKANSDDNSSSLKILGKEIKSSPTKYDSLFTDDKHFLNGDKCKHCEYISRSENSQGNLEEAEISDGFQNGEEREYHDGKIIRSSYYVGGGKSGMEYTYVDEKIVDSVYIQTTGQNNWNAQKLHNAFPSPVADYIYNLYFAKKNYQGFGITTYDSLASNIYYKTASDTGSGMPLVATVEYQNHRDPSNFKVHLRKPFFEAMVYQNNELIERKKVKGNTTLYEYKKDEYVKELYTNGKTKRTIIGSVQANVNESFQCPGECHSKSFYENGSRWEESYYTDNKVKQEMKWNKQNVLISDFYFPRYSKSFYDNGALEQELQGELAYDSLNNLIVKNGFLKEFYPNGKPKTDETYENGNYVKYKTWYPNGRIDTEAEVPKYLKLYYENGQLEKMNEGEIKQENGELVLINGTSKSWHSDGKPGTEGIYKNNVPHSLKVWDSTGFLELDFERDKYLKTYTNKAPSKHTDWSGNVVFENDSYVCKGKCIQKNYQDKILTDEEICEDYDSTSNKFKKRKSIEYDSSGRKTLEKEYLFDEIVSKKMWDSEKDFLILDININTHIKTYYAPKKLRLHFKGKSSMNNEKKFIDGTEIQYYENGKKSSETIWKNGEATSRKEWNENGNLTVEFALNKYFLTYHPNTKVVKSRYEGSVYFNGDKKYIVTDGELKTFDEKGKQIGTKKYVKGYPIAL